MNTRSEELFEAFLTSNGVTFSRIEEVKESGAKRPDYFVKCGDLKIMFEVKQLGDDDEDDNHAQLTGESTLGAQLRQCINRSKKQIQFGAHQGIASVLLVYNNIDPLWGTGEEDFRTAMYGELTMLIRSQERSEVFHGRKKEMQEAKNTSFSAVGHLCDQGGTTTVTLWENVHARVRIPFEQLPPCFAVRRVEIDRRPLSFSKRPTD